METIIIGVIALLLIGYLLVAMLVFAVFLVSQGIIQNFRAYDTATLVEPMGEVTTQTIVQDPLAWQSAIKMLGTNGGGYTNANSSQPLENPTPLANFFQMLSILTIASGFTWYLGKSTRN